MKRYDVYHTYGYTRVGLVLSTSSRADAIAQCDRNAKDAAMDGGF